MLGNSALWECKDHTGAETPSAGAITPRLGSFLPPPPQTRLYKTYIKKSGLAPYTVHPDEKSEAKQEGNLFL